MTPLEQLRGLYNISFGFWLLFCFYKILSIQRFIVKRYEKETNLLDTIYFREHDNFSKYLPPFFSAHAYCAHLIACTFAWQYVKTKKAFRDIQDPEYVTGHFSAKEIRCVKWFLVSGAIIIVHAIAFYLFKLIWPEFLAGPKG